MVLLETNRYLIGVTVYRETTTMVIDRFNGDYSFLSNFYPCQVMFESKTYASVEHAYQAAKTTNNHEREWIGLDPNPAIAKRRGRSVTLRKDWKEVQLPIMETCLRYKFGNGRLKEALIGTGDAELIEGNHWGDTFFGQCNGVGENHLGKLLMKIRAELQNG
jgi:N-glycosidase YbiA